MQDPLALLVEVGPWAYALLFLAIVADGIPGIGQVIPGFLLLSAAGAAAHLGALSVLGVVLVGCAAALVADLLAYGLGKRYGSRVVACFPGRIQRFTNRLEGGLHRHLGKTVVLARFNQVTRALSSPLAGSGRVPWRRFAPWAAVSCSVWSVRAAAIGWLGAAGVVAVGATSWLAIGVVVFGLFATLWVGRCLLREEPQPRATSAPENLRI